MMHKHSNETFLCEWYERGLNEWVDGDTGDMELVYIRNNIIIIVLFCYVSKH